MQLIKNLEDLQFVLNSKEEYSLYTDHCGKKILISHEMVLRTQLCQIIANIKIKKYWFELKKS